MIKKIMMTALIFFVANLVMANEVEPNKFSIYSNETYLNGSAPAWMEQTYPEQVTDGWHIIEIKGQQADDPLYVYTLLDGKVYSYETIFPETDSKNKINEFKKYSILLAVKDSLAANGYKESYSRSTTDYIIMEKDNFEITISNITQDKNLSVILLSKEFVKNVTIHKDSIAREQMSQYSDKINTLTEK